MAPPVPSEPHNGAAPGGGAGPGRADGGGRALRAAFRGRLDKTPPELARLLDKL